VIKIKNLHFINNIIIIKTKLDITYIDLAEFGLHAFSMLPTIFI